MGFLSSYLNLLRETVYKSFQANEGEISASCAMSKRFRLEERRVVPQNVAIIVGKSYESIPKNPNLKLQPVEECHSTLCSE
jgi:hypothetical protein